MLRKMGKTNTIWKIRNINIAEITEGHRFMMPGSWLSELLHTSLGN